jgi:pyrimidine-nucleoside phosphorylase
MRILDLITKKRNGQSLTRDEIAFFVRSYVDETVPDYQVSALLMAIFFQGMTPEETGYLTREMIDSGDTIDLSSLPGPFVDKHSTGGVGDKVSLILAPIAAACGVLVPMMSGRSLGHTGGTLDKLESIPGYTTAIAASRFAEIIAACGFAMTGQSARVVPADRKLYGLRDVTGTVESVPLITSSILSKKFAEGADALVFDVKTGSGAFMKTLEESRELAHSLVNTGKSLGKRIVAVLTRMDAPLGSKVGNFLEVEESLALLGSPAARERVPADSRSDDLMEVTLRLTAWMLVAAGIETDVDTSLDHCRAALDGGSAWRAMEENIALQGGDTAALESKLGSLRAPVERAITAQSDGYITAIDAYAVGMAGVYLGAGRSRTDDDVHPDVGFELEKKPGDAVNAGDTILRAWAHTDEAMDLAVATIEPGIAISTSPAPTESMIMEEISSI